MKYKKIDTKLFVKNRKNFVNKLEQKSIAFFNSNDIYPISADSTLPFDQHRDIFYLSGIDQEESILVLFPDSKNMSYKEMLFIRETNEHITHWEGEKLTKEQAKKISGINNVYWLGEFDDILRDVLKKVDFVYINTNEHYRQNVQSQTREDRFNNKLKNIGGLNFKKSNPILQKQRSIKDNIEIQLIKTACEITKMGFERVLNFIKPGVWEYEIEAEFSHEFLKNRSRKFAYTPIIASGRNSNFLHYIYNNKQCLDGEIVLMDVAAEYANYSSDMTRTVPVNGKFSKRQKTIYNAVLNVKNEATKLLRPGILWHEYHVEVGKIMTSELLKIKLLDKSDVQRETKKTPAYKKYFSHGTSHHLGLDTHDYCDLKMPMEKNMVLTVEPGIYIKEEGFGIRLEDDVVINDKGDPTNLMSNIPIEIDHIEELCLLYTSPSPRDRG